MAMLKNKKPIYESRAGNMKSTNAAGSKATALRLAGTTPFSRGQNSLRHLPLAQVSNTQPISRNGDGITPLYYGHYLAALTRNNAPTTSAFETSPPLLEEESMEEASVDGFDKEHQPENVPPQQVPVSAPYGVIGCPNALNDSAPFPRTLLSDGLNWPDFSLCLRSDKTPPSLPTTTSPSESQHRTGSARGSGSGNIRAKHSTPLPRGSYSPYYPIACGPVLTTSLPPWNPYWPSYPNGQGSQNMVPPVPGYFPAWSERSWFNSQYSPPLLLVPLPYGRVGWPYYHGFGTMPSWSPSYPSVRPSRNIPPARSRRGAHFSKRST